MGGAIDTATRHHTYIHTCMCICIYIYIYMRGGPRRNWFSLSDGLPNFVGRRRTCPPRNAAEQQPCPSGCFRQLSTWIIMVLVVFYDLDIARRMMTLHESSPFQTSSCFGVLVGGGGLRRCP